MFEEFGVKDGFHDHADNWEKEMGRNLEVLIWRQSALSRCWGKYPGYTTFE